MRNNHLPPAVKRVFEDTTGLIVTVVAETALNQRGVQIINGQEHTRRDGTGPTRQQAEYFVAFADLWVRWFYTNSSKWARAIHSTRNGGNYGRDFVYMWVGHWADAFLKDPAGYIQRHPLDQLDPQTVGGQ